MLKCGPDGFRRPTDDTNTLTLYRPFLFSLIACTAVPGHGYSKIGSLISTNDIADLGNGTIFGQLRESNSNMFDNDTGTRSLGVTSGYPAPVGIYGLTNQWKLVGFTVASVIGDRELTKFSIQGSTTTTNGLDGTWITVYSQTNAAWTELGSGIIHWTSDSDNFTTKGPFSAFRLLAEESGNGDTFNSPHLNEIEFLGYIAPSAGTLITLY